MTPQDDRFEAEVTALLKAEHAAACKESRPPAAGLVWFRAERRARREAAEAAARPTMVMLAVAAACAIGAAAALMPFAAPWIRQWTSAATELSTFSITTVALLVITPLVLAPLALYLALPDK